MTTMPDTSSSTLDSPGLGSLARKPKRGLNQKDSTYIYVAVSLVLHLILFAATSVNFIRDSWIDPQGAAARKAAAAAEKAAKQTPAVSQPTAPAATPAAATPAAAAPGNAAATPAKPAAPANNAAGATGSKSEQLMNDRKDTPIVKKTTEAAKPSELPKAPDDLGMGLDDFGGSKKK
jgi:hypothetical protein